MSPKLSVTNLDVIIINMNYTNSILNVPNDDMMLLLASELIIIKRIYETHTENKAASFPSGPNLYFCFHSRVKLFFLSSLNK